MHTEQVLIEQLRLYTYELAGRYLVFADKRTKLTDSKAAQHHTTHSQPGPGHDSVHAVV